MSYCPKCHHEYAETVENCIECGRRLRKGSRPVSLPMELEDYLIPAGAFACAVIGLLLLYLRVASQLGWITGPLATVILITQPACVTVFYVVAVIASILVLAWWAVQSLARRG